MWLHVGAAMAGSAMILPECRWMWQGVEGADSLVLNLVEDESLFAWGAAGLRRLDGSSDFADTTPADGTWSFGSLPIQDVAIAP